MLTHATGKVRSCWGQTRTNEKNIDLPSRSAWPADWNPCCVCVCIEHKNLAGMMLTNRYTQWRSTPQHTHAHHQHMCTTPIQIHSKTCETLYRREQCKVCVYFSRYFGENKTNLLQYFKVTLYPWLFVHTEFRDIQSKHTRHLAR